MKAVVAGDAIAEDRDLFKEVVVGVCPAGGLHRCVEGTQEEPFIFDTWDPTRLLDDSVVEIQNETEGRKLPPSVSVCVEPPRVGRGHAGRAYAAGPAYLSARWLQPWCVARPSSRAG